MVRVGRVSSQPSVLTDPDKLGSDGTCVDTFVWM